MLLCCEGLSSGHNPDRLTPTIFGIFLLQSPSHSFLECMDILNYLRNKMNNSEACRTFMIEYELRVDLQDYQ